MTTVPGTVWVEVVGWKPPRKNIRLWWHKLQADFLRHPTFFPLENSQRLLWPGLLGAAGEQLSAIVQVDLALFATYTKGTPDLMWSALKHFEAHELVRVYFEKPKQSRNPATPGAPATNPQPNGNQSDTDTAPNRNASDADSATSALRNRHQIGDGSEPDAIQIGNQSDTAEREKELEIEQELEQEKEDTREREKTRARVDRRPALEAVKAALVEMTSGGGNVVDISAAKAAGKPLLSADEQKALHLQPQPGDPVYVADDDLAAKDRQFAESMLRRVKALNPNLLEANASNLGEWAATFRRMREDDGVTHEQLAAAILFALQDQPDQFWRFKVTSPAKLRERWDTIVAQMQEANYRPRKGGFR